MSEIKITDFRYQKFSRVNNLIYYYVRVTINNKYCFAKLWNGSDAGKYLFIDSIKEVNGNEMYSKVNEKERLKLIEKTLEKIKETKELRIKAIIENWSAWKSTDYINYMETFWNEGGEN